MRPSWRTRGGLSRVARTRAQALQQAGPGVFRMAGNRNEGADVRRKLSRVATLPARGSASLPEKAQVVLHLWVIAALLTLIVKAAMS